MVDGPCEDWEAKPSGHCLLSGGIVGVGVVQLDEVEG